MNKPWARARHVARARQGRNPTRSAPADIQRAFGRGYGARFVGFVQQAAFYFNDVRLSGLDGLLEHFFVFFDVLYWSFMLDRNAEFLHCQVLCSRT